MEEKARGKESEKGNIVVKREKERDNEKKKSNKMGERLQEKCKSGVVELSYKRRNENRGFSLKES